MVTRTKFLNKNPGRAKRHRVSRSGRFKGLVIGPESRGRTAGSPDFRVGLRFQSIPAALLNLNCDSRWHVYAN